MKPTKLFVAALASALVVLPSLTVADSDFDFGVPGTTSATANLDFVIVIPSFVYFQIGDPGFVERVEFDMSLGTDVPGDGTAVSATGGTADGADGTLTVRLMTNANTVSIAATDLTGGNLNGLIPGNTIPFTDINPTGGTIPVPGFGATIASFSPAAFDVTDTWSYEYANTTGYAADTYSGTAIYTVTTL